MAARSKISYWVGCMLAVSLLLAAGCGQGAADTSGSGGERADDGGDASAAPFYQGKTITIIVNQAAGETRDLEARLFADFLGEKIPGKPRIRIENIPGASGFQAVKTLHSVSKPDGLTIGYFGDSIPSQQLLQKYGVAEEAVLDVDVSELAWVAGTGGRVMGFYVNSSAPYRDIYELMEGTEPLKVGATRPGSTTFTGPALIKETLGAPLDIITGYESSERDLAMFRGEIDGQYGTWGTFLSRNADWFKEGRVKVFVNFGLRLPEEDIREYNLGEVPHILDLVKDPDNLALLRLADYPDQWGRIAAAPPGTPEERVKILMDAFTSLADDPAFQEEAKKRDLTLDPFPGTEVRRLIQEYLDSPQAIVERYLQMVEES